MPAGPRDPKAFTRWFRLDYFRRPRGLRRAYTPVLIGVLLLTAAAAGAAVACVRLKPAGARAAFQAAPVSTPHALFADRCEVCHVEDHAFHTAFRLWPAAGASSVSDSACLQCHDAGIHNAQQTAFADQEAGKSTGCTQCHHEHRGDAALVRLPDATCTRCHADLQTLDGRHRYHANVTRFEADHSSFGEWRKDSGGLSDPGTIRFSHAAHLTLDAKLREVLPERASPWLDANRKQAGLLTEQGCAYCHKTDTQGRTMQPIRYQDHCAACHPLLPTLDGDAAAAGVARTFSETPLHHPGPGETAAAVRGELLDRFSRLALFPMAPLPADEEVRPFFLNRPIPPLDDRQRRTVAGVVHAERSLFGADAKDLRPLPGFEERVDFDVKAGCAFCHEEAGRSKDGLPLYQPSQLPDRWFPNARFDHQAHRMMKCADCHAAGQSKQSSDVLMPVIDECKKCHNTTEGRARSDCLECHAYHDHGGDRPAAEEAPAVRALLGPHD